MVDTPSLDIVCKILVNDVYNTGKRFIKNNQSTEIEEDQIKMCFLFVVSSSLL